MDFKIICQKIDLGKVEVENFGSWWVGEKGVCVVSGREAICPFAEKTPDHPHVDFDLSPLLTPPDLRMKIYKDILTGKDPSNSRPIWPGLNS